MCFATVALAMAFTLPAALRQQKLTIGLVRRGSLWDIRCAPAKRGGTWIQCRSAAVTCGIEEGTVSALFYGGPKGCKATHAARLQNGPFERCIGRAHSVMNVCSRPVA